MWTRVTLTTPDNETAQLVASELWGLGARGWEMRDAETFSELDGSAFRAKVSNGVEIIAYFPAHAEAPAFEDLLVAHPGTRLLAVQPYDDLAWQESWRQFFAPMQVSPRLGVRPSWSTDVPSGNPPVVLVVDPGMAFGTGTHETTRLCLRAVDTWLGERGGGRVLDVGCGSGILTLAAHQLGAERAYGVDNDPEAIRVAGENWALNELGSEDSAPFGLDDLDSLGSDWDLVLANIISGTLLELRDRLIARLAPSGLLVASGVLASERDPFVAGFGGPPLTLVDERQDGEWMAFWLRRA